MTRRAIHAYTWAPIWTTDHGARAVDRAAALGYDYLVVPLRDHDRIEPARIARMFADAGIRPVTTSPLQAETDISSTDAGVRQRGIDRHLAALDLAAAIGADRIGGILYSRFGKADRAAGPDNFKAAAEGLAVVAERARSMGMILSLEVVNRYETNLINTAADAARMIMAIGAKNIGIHLDTFHMNIEEDDMLAALETALPHLCYFEIDQNHRGRLGRGSIDFSPLLGRLKQANYQGIVGIEAFSASVSHPDIAAGVAAWRNLFDDGDEVGREGIALLERHGF